MTNQTIKPTGCCELFNPEPWQGKEITWKKHFFLIQLAQSAQKRTARIMLSFLRR
jgi:hypothetical protein